MPIFKLFNLRDRIFLSIVSVVVISSLFTALVVVFHFQKTNDKYHNSRLERKESIIRLNIDYIIAQSPENATPRNIPSMLEGSIFKLSQINEVEINIFSLSGDLLISSDPPLIASDRRSKIPAGVLAQLSKKPQVRVRNNKRAGDTRTNRSAYSFIYNLDHQPVAILNLSYMQGNTFLVEELHAFLKDISVTYLFIIIGSIFLSLYLSKSITKQLEIIQNRLKRTQLTRRNEQIKYDRHDEVRPLIDAYNEMLVELEQSTESLAKTEREYAWREMARQVVHEIKNPLTPMRLMVQNFMQRYNPTAVDAKQKLSDFSKSMIRQIDTLSAIASAFSDFARMPTPIDEVLALDPSLAKALDLFDSRAVSFEPGAKGVAIFMDKSQFNRLITNVLKNALQAIPAGRKPEIYIRSSAKNAYAVIEIQDNGSGIPADRKELIFEPQFTTKSSGMGLGLAIVKRIVKSYGGKIHFKTKPGSGSSFYIELPIEKMKT